MENTYYIETLKATLKSIQDEVLRDQVIETITFLVKTSTLTESASFIICAMVGAIYISGKARAADEIRKFLKGEITKEEIMEDLSNGKW